MKSLVRLVARVPKPIAIVALAAVLAGGVLTGIVIVQGDDAEKPRHVVVGPPSTTTTVPPDAVPKIEAGPTPTGPTVSVQPVAPKPQASTRPQAGAKPTAATVTTTTITTATTAPPADPAPTTTSTTMPPKQSAGEEVAYPTGPGDAIEENHVYVLGVDDAQAHSVYTSEFILDRNEWSADGRRILVSHDNETHDVLSMNLDGTGQAKLGKVTFESATWSAQGDLATIDYDGTGHELVITKADGAEVRIEHEDVGPVSGRSWSPDGSHIAFIADGRVWTATADGEDVIALTPSGSKAWRWLRWSPDESMIAFQDHQVLFVVGADGTDLRQLGPVNADPSFDWSPDSTRLVVCAPFSPSLTRLHMSIVPVDGSAPTPLGVQGMEVSWSPDGSTIAYKSWPFVNGTLPVAVINPDGTNKRVLASPPIGVFFGLGLDWSPDSTHLLVNTGSSGPGGASEPT